MPTYLYEDTVTRERHEVTQRITEKPYFWRDPATGEWGRSVVCGGQAPGQPWMRPEKGNEVKRLIAGAPAFNLIAGDSGGWASTGYSKNEAQRAAEATLGRKLHKPL